jgi:hypothetical protein
VPHNPRDCEQSGYTEPRSEGTKPVGAPLETIGYDRCIRFLAPLQTRAAFAPFDVADEVGLHLVGEARCYLKSRAGFLPV